MFKRLAMVVALGCAALLSACNTSGTDTPVSVQVSTAIVQVQETTKAICGYLPIASTVASIIASFTGAGGAVDLVTQAAQGICAAVTAKGARRGMGPPKYRGVAIRGQFIR